FHLLQPWAWCVSCLFRRPNRLQMMRVTFLLQLGRIVINRKTIAYYHSFVVGRNDLMKSGSIPMLHHSVNGLLLGGKNPQLRAVIFQPPTGFIAMHHWAGPHLFNQSLIRTFQPPGQSIQSLTESTSTDS